MADLWPRVVSGLAMAVIGFICAWFGGLWFDLLLTLVVTLITWELGLICGAREPRFLAAVSGICCLGVMLLPEGSGLPFLLAPAFLGLSRVEGRKVIFAIVAVFVVLAGYGLSHIRGDLGLTWVIWLILVVIATDVFGYFAGRLIGGPRFWPRVSPKKTWSGTVAGWIASAIVGAIFWIAAETGFQIIGFSIALSMASQLGDLAESSLKRQAGIKDSSGLLPGHGGLFDRFDGVLGAMALFLMVEQVAGFDLMVHGG
ncbi:MAG: phosphatidate cytidylyltransferase [Mangrovicoccus sp.]